MITANGSSASQKRLTLTEAWRGEPSATRNGEMSTHEAADEMSTHEVTRNVHPRALKSIQEHSRAETECDCTSHRSVFSESPEEQAWAEFQTYANEHIGGSPFSLGQHVLAAYGAHRLWDADCWQEEATPLWQFLRVCKAHPELNQEPPGKVEKRISQIITTWSKGGREAAWLKYFNMGHEDAVAEIHDVWPKIKCAYGSSPFEEAMARAKKHPIVFHKDDITVDSPGYRQFLSFAGWLQVVTTEVTITLPIDFLSSRFEVTRKTSSRMAINRKTVSRWRQFAVDDGFLFVVKKHAFGKGRRLATRFLFDVQRVPMLRKVCSPETLRILEDHHEAN